MKGKLLLGVAIGLLATQVYAQEKGAQEKGAQDRGAQERGAKKIELKTTADKATYAMGAIAAMNVRQSLEMLGVEVDPDTLLRGFRESLSGGKLTLNEDDMDAALQALQTDAAKRNAEEGEKYLDANGKKKDVVTTKSGLQYKILKKGAGKTPTLHDVVSVNFRGRFVGGKEFANSLENKEPYAIAVANVIEGWKEALQQMPVGSKWELYIPPDLAYGPMGAANFGIGPNRTLVYEIELVSVTKPPAAGALPPRGQPRAPEDVK